MTVDNIFKSAAGLGFEKVIADFVGF